MKSRCIQFVTAVLLCASLAHSQELQIRLTPEHSQLGAGEAVELNLEILPPGGFTAMLNLRIEAPTLVQEKPALSSQSINPPYEGAKVTLRTIAGHTRGEHTIKVTAYNGSLSASATASVNVANSTHWKVLPNIKTRFFLHDQDGNYWFNRVIPEVSGGVGRLNEQLEKEFWYYYHIPGFPQGASFMRYAVTDRKNKKWFGTRAGGIYAYDNTYWSVLDTTNSPIPNNFITALAVDSSDNLWVGTMRGLSRISGTSWTHYNASNATLASERINSVSVDPQNRVWVGTNNGLSVFDGNTWAQYTSSNSGLPMNAVWHVAAGGDGRIWLIPGRAPTDFIPNQEPQETFGLVKFDGQNWISFTTGNSDIPTNYLSWILVDRSDRIWITTNSFSYHAKRRGFGLLGFDGSQWTRYDTLNSPLPSNSTLWVGMDNDNNILVSTSEGTAIFNEAGLPGRITLDMNEQSYVADVRALYPNPASGTAQLKYRVERAGQVDVSLSGAMGETIKVLLHDVLHEPGEYMLPVDVSGLSTGMYFLSIRTPAGIRTARLSVLR